MFHKIISVAPLPDFRLLAHFSDGTAKEYNVKPLIESMNIFEDLERMPGLFEQVAVDQGGYGISWNDDIDLDSNEIWENGTIVETPFDGLLSALDATDLWGLNESTLRKAVSYGKLKNGIDIVKYGKQWIVTKEAMIREYGQLQSAEDESDLKAYEEAMEEYRKNPVTYSHEDVSKLI